MSVNLINKWSVSKNTTMLFFLYSILVVNWKWLLILTTPEIFPVQFFLLLWSSKIVEPTATNPSFMLLILISHLHITSLQRVNLLSWVISVIFSILVIYEVYVHCRSTLRVLIWSLYRICYWIRRGSLAVCLYSNPHIHFAFACSDCSFGVYLLLLFWELVRVIQH